MSLENLALYARTKAWLVENRPDLVPK